jgi:NAD(P)-dependent dehydrogenase (short-subunit alcohol dehydrogenase family)
MSNFEGKTAIVTGGGSGLGEAISKDLAKNGVNVVVVDINLDGATRVANEITALAAPPLPFRPTQRSPRIVRRPSTSRWRAMAPSPLPATPLTPRPSTASWA